jgi:hypothetical protein
MAWIDPRLIVHTPDPQWGRFSRRQGMLWRIVGALLSTVDDRELAPWLAEFNLIEPVRVARCYGPAGPVYRIGSGGSHRIHLARMLRLPLLYRAGNDHYADH